MELKTIDEKTYQKYAQNHPSGTFLQSIEEKKLKESFNESCYLLGLYDKKKLIGVTLLIEIPTKLHRNIFYAPRGFLTDYSNSSYIEGFTEELKKFSKSHKGLEFIIDPYLIYQIYDKNENVQERHNEIIDFLKILGYHHKGFNLNFEASQVRFLYRFLLSDTYEDTFTSFQKSTRKRIEEAKEKGVFVREASFEEIPIVTDLLKASADNKHFEFRSVNYYEKFKQAFQNQVTYYIASIDFFKYEKNIKNKLMEKEKELDCLKIEMSKVNVGEKLKRKQEILENQIQKCLEEQEQVQTLKTKYGNTLDIGALVSIKSNQEYITLTSGMLPEFRSFNPKYAMYEAHIKDAIKEHFEYVNFYGISGDLNPKNELYGIYDLKKGFNGNIIELVGEFYYPTSKLDSIYHFLLKMKDRLKK